MCDLHDYVVLRSNSGHYIECSSSYISKHCNYEYHGEYAFQTYTSDHNTYKFNCKNEIDSSHAKCVQDDRTVSHISLDIQVFDTLLCTYGLIMNKNEAPSDLPPPSIFYHCNPIHIEMSIHGQSYKSISFWLTIAFP